MHKKLFLLFTLLLISTVTLSTCSATPQQNNEEHSETIEATQTPENTETTQQEVQTISLTAEQDEENAFELLQSQHEVSAKTYDFGVFIEEIDGVKNTDKNYWALYVNGEYAQKGADQTMLQKGDTIEFRYEEIQQ